MSTDSHNEQQVPPNLLGIKVVYCDGGQMKEMWVDLIKVSALSWGVPEINKTKPHGNGSPHGPRLPKGGKPGPCVKDAGGPGGAGMCWWNGTDWVCGEAEE